jgi:hypothetical protein
LGGFTGYLTDHETHSQIFEEGEWTDLEAALAWASERADRVVLTYGGSRDAVFSAGAVYWPGEGAEPLPQWPPEESMRARIDAEAEREAPAEDSGSDRLGVEQPEIVEAPDE